jgi:two-component system NarL family sensor kinase
VVFSGSGEQTTASSDAAQLWRRNRELAILNSIAEALNRSVDLDQALQAGLAQVAELLDLQTGWIWLLREETGESYLAAAQNLPPALADNPARMEGSCYCLDTFRAGDLDGAANVNVVTCSRLKGLVDGTDGLRYHASIPLYDHGQQLGVLNVASTDWRELSAEDLRLLYTVGDLLSIAIARACLFARSANLGALEERNRLAREIHDTLAQGLSGIALQLETADALLDASADSERIRTAVLEALTLTRSNLEAARRSVLDLRAAPLEGRSLDGALAALAAETQTEHLRVDLETVGAERPLPARVEVGLYRIAQEALTNVIRHADARHVALRLTSTPEQVQLEVEDDGRGFDPANVGQNRYGLTGMNERAKLLAGSLELESCPGEGTRLEVVVPVN